MSNKRHITILGGGPAGLACAWYAHQSGTPFRLLEAAPRVGGNSITFQHGPFRFDSGAHRFHDKYPEVTATMKALLGDDLQPVDALSQIYFDGRYIDFPLTPLNLLKKLGVRNIYRASTSLMKGRMTRKAEARNFKALAVAAYGSALAERFLLNYSEKLWGVPAAQLSTQVAGARMKGLDLKTFLLESFFGKSTKTAHLDGAFLYPQKGIGQIFDTLEASLPAASIHKNSRVKGLRHERGKITSVEVNGKKMEPVQQVISTLPLQAMVEPLQPVAPDEMRQLARQIRFRHVLLAAFFIKRKQVTPNASIYFPQREFLFTRVVEPKNRSAQMAPADQTALVAEVPAFSEDELWRLSEPVLLEKVKQQLVGLGLAVEAEIAGQAVPRVYNAYPVLEVGIEAKVARLTDFLTGTFPNLHLIGRSGQFTYSHIHDQFRDARRLILED